MSTIYTIPLRPRGVLIRLRLSTSHQPLAYRRLFFTTSPSSSGPPPSPLTTLHTTHVTNISSAIRSFAATRTPFRISHGTTNSTRQSPKGKAILDTSPLSQILHIDPATKTAWIEPNVPMDRLVTATLRHGLVPPVVMEFPGITVGGGYSGTSGESSSFRHGFFNETINSVEVVLADGEVITASPTQNSDLFRGAAGALGTLGVTTLVELQLQPARKYVETTYHPVTSVADAKFLIRQFTQEGSGYDYVDGILYSPTEGAIITGRLSDTAGPHTIQRFSAAKDPWFYLHVQDSLRGKSGAVTESIPLAEYLFRYDRGGFWVGKSAFDYFSFPFNSVTRWWLDDFLHTRMLYSALHASGESRKYIVQDLAVPYQGVEEFVEWTAGRVGIWPLWLCPLRQSEVPTMHPHHVGDGGGQEEMLNIGVWGSCPPGLDFIQTNRELEKKVKDVGGMKWLYAQTYYTEDEFWEGFDKEWYDGLRRKYKAEGLPSVFDKVRYVPEEATGMKGDEGWGERMRGVWPLSGVYGIKKAIESGLYKEARKAGWKEF